MRVAVVSFWWLLVSASCGQPGGSVTDKAAKRAKNGIEESLPKSSVVLTDSARLVKHLDSLPLIKFPYKSEWYNRDFPTIDLSEFENKRLFNLPYKRIETQIGGGILDDDRVDLTFNLVDPVTYKGEWNLIAKTPKFIVVEVHDGVKLVTLTYDLKLIDAINSAAADPSGNRHFNANRHTTIYKDLRIVLHHEYNVQVDDEGNFDKETDSEEWLIDRSGHFKKAN